MQFLQRLIEIILKEHRRLKRLYRVIFVLACVVVFITTYALTLPAITIDKETAARMGGMQTGTSQYRVGMGKASDETATTDGSEEGGSPADSEADSEELSSADDAEPGEAADDSGFNEESGGGSGEDAAGEDPDGGAAGSGAADGAEAETSKDADAEATEGADTDGGSNESAGDDVTDSTGDDGESASADGTGEGSATAGTSATDAAAAAATVDPAAELITEETELTAEGSDYKVYVTVTPEAKLPKGTVLQVREITKESDEEEYQLYFDKAQKELRDKYDENTSVSFARFYDISFLYNGVKIEPAGKVTVRIEYEKAVEVTANAGLDTVHFDEQKEDRPEFIESEMKTEDGLKIKTGAGSDTGNAADKIAENSGSAEKKGSAESEKPLQVNEIEFESDKFSVYGVVGTTIEKTILAGDGHNYTVKVTYGSDAGIPAGTELEVNEITQDDDASDEPTEYEILAEKTGEALGLEAPVFEYARFFDISLVKDGEKIRPAEGSKVNVTIELADADSDSLKVVHFAGSDAEQLVSEDGQDNAEQITSETREGTVEFETEGFSVYAIVDAPEPVPAPGWNRVSSLEEIAQLGSEGFYMHNPGGFYFKGDQYNISDTRTGIHKTKPANPSPDSAVDNGAVKYYFEQQGENKYKVYCLDDDGNRLYIYQSGNSLGLTENGNQATVFTASAFPGQANTFRMLGNNNYYWNMQGGNNGDGFAAYTGATDTNARIQLEYYSDTEPDPYGLDGATFGIAYHDNSATSAALMAQGKKVSGKDRLTGFQTVMKPDVLDNDGTLLVAENTDITEWTFESVAGDKYYITTNVDGAKKYLTIDGDQVRLTDAPDPNGKSTITAKPGTGANSGKWHFSVGNYSLNLAGNANGGFNAATGNGATTWLNLVEKSVLNDDDFHLYNAQKVSVSDEVNVYDGQQIIIYTRIWNETKKQYEFFVVDHDGSLIPCYDIGDKIEWIGSNVNTALWTFNEYRNPDGTLNYYYDLQNTQYGDYLAPQEADGQILSGDPVGLNMNGRRYGGNTTSIVAWDDHSYAFTGFKTENGHVVPCPVNESEDFYFAVVTPVDPHDNLTTVQTIDSTQYGITMKMVDFNNPIVDDRDSKQTEYLGRDSNYAGLLTTDLDENGYPTTTGTGRSLSGLYEGEGEVNHLFLQSIYNESGYFEYNSTANFARLEDSGNFTVYDQLAAIGTATGPTRTHGQFMPYNDLVAGRYATVTNQTDVLQHALPDTDPRKGEKLYLIGQNEADYFFGMEMEAQFTQTASGLDEWGHDIIFEFSGDDDFWFYVDGELVLDLGGVHSAMTGSINFRTGVVQSSRGNSTLYDIFKSNYQARGLSESEIAQKLDEIFTTNESGQHIFKDYTNHTMKMFYMERGAGASNLHMRFNLAAVKPGTVVLSKKLSGTESADNSVIEFPYQIYYKTKNDYGETFHRLEEKTGDKYNVTYKGTTTNAKYASSFTPAGGTEQYEDVFFLKPGQAVVIDLPDDTIQYYIVECGVNPSVYDKVTVNDDETPLVGTPTSDPNRFDYATTRESMKDRPEVDFDNHVKDGAMRTLSFNKWLYDVDGINRLHYSEDPTLFTFRLYLGNENEDAGNLPLADMYDYHVKDPDGNYCRFNKSTQKFESLSKTDYDALTEQEKVAATFTTSIYGTISKIPADYTVEVRNLIVGTQYKVEERPSEIPKGYTLRLEDGYMRTDTDPPVNNHTTPITGTMQVDEDPEIRVSNQKGWGLTVEKVWTDKDFMETHDDIYFAVYLTKDGGIEADPIEGTVRRLATTESEVYYFFGQLGSERPFSDYVVREVTLEGDIQVDSEGVVTRYTSVTPIEEPWMLIIGGKPVGGEYKEDNYEYTVHYEQGKQTTQNENVRTDTVTNGRPGIELFKEDLSGNPLAGAVFTLTDEDGQPVAAPTYTSRTGDGRITIAYLSQGTYTLTETSAPRGFVVLPQPVTITVGEDDSVTLDLPEELQNLVEIELSPESGMTAAITVKDRPTAFRTVKVGKENASSETVVELQGVHFALYRQVRNTEGQYVKDYLPMSGYEDLVTDENGLIPKINLTLNPGTYYLTETRTVEDYDLLTQDLCFTIGRDGKITIENDEFKSWLTQEEDPVTHDVSYVITIPNMEQQKASFKKVDIADPQNSALSGAVFDLYRVVNGTREATPMYKDLISGTDGMLAQGDLKEFQLAIGMYHLVETRAPNGYMLKKNPVVITVTADGITYDDGGDSAIPYNGTGISTDPETGVCCLLITDKTGVALPSTGGPGTGMITVLGLILVVTAAAGLALRAAFRAERGRIKSG